MGGLTSPLPYLFTFFIFIFQNKTVDQNIEQGVLISGSSLVLQSVTRAQAGNYTCVASNLEGDAESNILEIAIKCESGMGGILCIFNNILYYKII